MRDGTQIRAPAIILAAALLFSFPAPARTVRFSGELRHGESIRRALRKDLWFCLTALADTGRNSGWYISIKPSCERESPDYAGPATPPYHGPNPLAIVAWFFDEGANAPHNIHDFRFVLNAVERDRLANALNAGPVLELLDKLARGRGRLAITGRRMNSRDGSIDWIRFTVRLDWPD